MISDSIAFLEQEQSRLKLAIQEQAKNPVLLQKLNSDLSQKEKDISFFIDLREQESKRTEELLRNIDK